MSGRTPPWGLPKPDWPFQVLSPGQVILLEGFRNYPHGAICQLCTIEAILGWVWSCLVELASISTGEANWGGAGMSPSKCSTRSWLKFVHARACSWCCVGTRRRVMKYPTIRAMKLIQEFFTATLFLVLPEYLRVMWLLVGVKQVFSPHPASSTSHKQNGKMTKIQFVS